MLTPLERLLGQGRESTSASKYYQHAIEIAEGRTQFSRNFDPMKVVRKFFAEGDYIYGT